MLLNFWPTIFRFRRHHWTWPNRSRQSVFALHGPSVWKNNLPACVSRNTPT